MSTKEAIITAVEMNVLEVYSIRRLRRMPFQSLMDLLEECGFTYEVTYDKNGLLCPEWEVM